MGYKTLKKEEGWKFLSKVWTIFLSKNSGRFANSFPYREIKSRCLLVEEESRMYFYLTLEEIQSRICCLNPLPSEIHLKGIYDEPSLGQMEADGKIKEINGELKSKIIDLMMKRLSEEKVTSDNFITNIRSFLDEEKKEKSLKSLSGEGKLYCLEPTSYGYFEYEKA